MKIIFFITFVLQFFLPVITLCQSRAAWPVRSQNGMVASSDGIASKVGADILKQGGNAVDAAVAVALTLAVTWPAAGNLGGGGFMLIRKADGTTTVIDYRETAPAKANKNMYVDKKGILISNASIVGYGAIGVPGTIAGLALALEKYGTMKWQDIIEPARKLAEEGFVPSYFILESIQRNKDLLKQFPESRRIFLKNGENYHEGELFKQPELAGTLLRLKSNGPREFYEGKTAKLIADDMKKNKGLITLDDLKHYKPVERQPVYGDVWIGGHSLARWSSRNENFDTLISVYGGVNKYNDDIVALTSNENGSLWLHNAENGLLEYRIQERQFKSYARHNGMPFEVLEGVSPVINDILWISSSSNLIRFDTRTKKIFVYDHNDGFPDEAPKYRKMYYDAIGGRMYLLFNESILRFDPSLQLKSPVADNILLTELRTNNNRSIYYPADDHSFLYNENNHSLSFTIIDYDNNNYQFEYRINETVNWTDLDKQRSLNLTSLSPGTYKVHLRAIGKSGDEKLKTFSFTIKPPFWSTVWFYAIGSILLLTVIYLFYRARIKAIRERANVDKLLAQTELKALHAQMNPHFISNSLNSIREMILNDENKQASHFLTKFAHLIRITLDQSSQTFISLRNTIDYLNRYIEMEQIRNDQFVSNIYVDEELNEDEILLPPMLIQPFIENSIWHGLDGEDKSIAVAIHFKKQDEKLVCIIDDNGIGIKQSLEMKKMGNGHHSSVAVFNIKQRINLLNEKYDLRSSVTIEDKMSCTAFPEKGTRVILNLPLQLNHLADN